MSQQKKNEFSKLPEENIIEKKPEIPAETEKKTSAISRQFGIITLIIAVVAVIISINSLIKLKEWNIGLKNIQLKMDERFKLEQKELDSLEDSVKSLNAQQKVLGKHLNYFHTAILPILQENRPVDMVWQLQKAYGWIKQAQLDLRWSGDLQGAVLLLNSSEDVLKQSKIPKLQPIYALIAEDIAALEAIKPVKELDVLTQIKTISDEIKLLPTPTVTELQPTQNTTTTESGWRATLHKGFDAIKKMIIVRATDANNPLPSKQLREILNDNIEVALQQTQWALLKKDNALFHWSINQVIELIQKNGTLIDLKNQKAVECLNGLKALEQQNLSPVLPNLEPAAQQLKAYLDTLTMQPIQPQPSNSSQVNTAVVAQGKAA